MVKNASTHTSPRDASFSDSRGVFSSTRTPSASHARIASARPTPARHSETGAVRTKSSKGRDPAATVLFSFVTRATTTNTLFTPPSASASPRASERRISSKGRAAPSASAARAFSTSARRRLGHAVSLTEGHARFESGTTAHVARGSLAAGSKAQACAPTRHAPRAEGDTATTTIDSSFAVIARRLSRTRSTVGAKSARIASSVAGSSGALANETGSCSRSADSIPRSRFACASHRDKHAWWPVVLVAVYTPRGTHSSSHAAAVAGTASEGDAGTSTPSTTTMASFEGAPGAPAIVLALTSGRPRAPHRSSGSF